MGLLVCLAGQIGSGKSSVRKTLAKELGWNHVSFGDYLRARIEKSGGDPTSREALQDLGKRLIETDPVSFCQCVLDSGCFDPGSNFLIDGVRHANVLHILRDLASPSTTKLLFLAATDDTRRERVSTRADHGDFARAEGHAVEADINGAVRALADVTVNGELPIETVVSECIAIIRSWQSKT